MEAAIHRLNAIALDPRHAVVIEACAGSGKTWLLVSRIVRLLLAGVKPSEILAITFTRKAAQEMESRLHQWLHLLATAGDEEVAVFLRDREVPETQIAGLLPQARGLLERFLTDQPGITVSTFHGWFLHLLKRAPLTSGAASGANLSDRTSALREEAWELFAEGLERNRESPVARALDALLDAYGLENTHSLLISFTARRAEWWAYTRERKDPVSWALERLRAGMPVAPDADVAGELFGGECTAQLGEFAALLERNGTRTDAQFAARIRAALADGDPLQRFETVWPALMTGDGDLRKRAASQAQEKRLGAEGQRRFLELHEELGRAFLQAHARLVEQGNYRLNEAGLVCGAELLACYQRIKRDRGLIDYTDVEWLAYLLLNHSDYAEYMQYKLDARYRHILLDEFQDTNPLQWQVLSAWLAASAAAGSPPTLFLVGDPKQSIYRFRRAEPRLFGIVAQYLEERFGAKRLDQNVTRRNAPPVVSAVNRVFAGGMENFHEHRAFQEALPGSVEVLPLIGNGDAPQPEPVPWRNPLETPQAEGSDRRREQEAAQLAARIGEIVGRRQIAGSEGPRPARFEDIMLLVRARTHLEVYERALRHAQIPYVSSRQGGLLDTLEADDLTALLQFLVIPFADLHLAAALRSPVFAASDDDLMALAETEGRTWWQRLRKVVADGAASPALARAHRLLEGWLAGIDRLPVHDLLDRIYFEGDVMRRYEAAVPAPMRMGVAANLRAFMEVALSTDSGRYPSLQGFLHELSNLRRVTPEEAPDVGIIAEGTDAVRILTVHGAKGLEAPVVWLLDANAADKKSEGYSVLVDWPPEAPAPAHFSLFGRIDERGVSRAALFERDRQLAERENLNLLYVAMTRPKQVLFVSGVETKGADGSWYRKIADAVEGAAPAGIPLAATDAGREKPAELAAASPEQAALLEALRRPLDVGRRTDDLVDRRRRYGVLLHALMQMLTPPGNVGDRDFLGARLGVSDEEFGRLWKDAQVLLSTPELERFFDPKRYVRAENELAYVTASGELRRIDRLVEFEDEVWILDYKTGDPVDPGDLAAAARPYRGQLAEYRAAIGRLIAKPVKSALVFGGGLLHPLGD